jgi:hypothetical protein
MNSGVILMILWGYPVKLFTNDPTIKYQPSVSTNIINLNGNDTITGGSIIMPMESSTLATTISIIKKGT